MNDTASPRPAGFVSRLLALSIDAVVITVVLALGNWISTIIASMVRLSAPSWVERQGRGVAVGVWVAFVILYEVVSWSGFGRTLGKALMGLRVVTRDGERVGVLRAFARVFGYVVAAIPLYAGFAWVIVDERRRGWHDFIAGTHVLYAPGRFALGRRTGSAPGTPTSDLGSEIGESARAV